MHWTNLFKAPIMCKAACQMMGRMQSWIRHGGCIQEICNFNATAKTSKIGSLKCRMTVLTKYFCGFNITSWH